MEKLQRKVDIQESSTFSNNVWQNIQLIGFGVKVDEAKAEVVAELISVCVRKDVGNSCRKLTCLHVHRAGMSTDLG